MTTAQRITHYHAHDNINYLWCAEISATSSHKEGFHTLFTFEDKSTLKLLTTF